jgi:citrate lyase subunit beta / citryl-CoA lyase
MLRSLLFVPANHSRRVGKALNSEADAVILDLEDSVAPAEKVSAREQVLAALSLPRAPLCYVRVNDLSTEWALQDLLSVVHPGLDGVLLPKVVDGAQLETVDWLLRNLEHERGLRPGTIDLIPILETAAAFTAIHEIARASPRVRRLAFGAADFAMDTGLASTPEEQELLFPRTELVIASRAASLESPVDSVWIHLDDAAGLAASVARAHALGFQGKLCVHPAQLSPVNEGFAPSPAEIESAQRIVSAFRAAEGDGVAAIRVDGRMVDYPVVHQAEKVLARHTAILEKRKPL